VGDSFAGITVPEGEPGELRSAGQTFAGISGALQGVSSELGALPGMLSAWQGPASVNYAGSVLTNGSALDAGTEALRSASLAANRYAEELEQAQDDARAAIRDARIAQKRIDQAEVDIDSAQGRAGVARVNLAVASGRVLATGLTGLPSPDALADQSAAERAIGEAEADAGRARRELAQAQEDLKLAQQRGRRAEQDARDAARTVAGAFGTAGAGSPAVALFGSPGAAVAGGGANPFGDAARNFLPLAQFGMTGARMYGVAKYIPYARAAQSWNAVAPGSPLAMWANAQATARLPTFNNGLIGRTLASQGARVPALRGAASWLGDASKATPIFQRVSIAGGALSTGMDLYGLYKQGNPVKAFKRNPAGYASDWSRTAFSASSTAFFVAPSPVTGGLVIATGAAWATTEAWEHREAIGRAVSTGAEYAWDNSLPGAVWNNREEIGQAFNDGRQWAGEAAADVRDKLDAGADFARDRLSEAGEGLKDAPGEAVEGARDLLGI